MQKLLYIISIVFIILVAYFLIPHDQKWALFPLIGILLLIFSILGIIIIVKAIRMKDKKFFLLTGISAIGIPLCMILHNLVYALMVTLGANPESDEAVFFILALFVFPILFIIGVVGSYISLRKKAR